LFCISVCSRAQGIKELQKGAVLVSITVVGWLLAMKKENGKTHILRSEKNEQC
jgi:hypothetical protein